MSYVSPEKLQRFWNRVKPTLDGKLTASGVVNNDTTTLSGYVLDARMGKTHGDEIDALANRVATLETSFPDGCSTIADAVTNNGVTTASNASPSTIATNIGKIRDSGDATNAQILTGKKAWVRKTLITGQMPDNGAVNQSLALNGTYTIPAGYHNGSGKVTQSLTAETVSVSTTAATGSKTTSVTAGYYNKVTVDQTGAYNAGYDAGNAAGQTTGDAAGYLRGHGPNEMMSVYRVAVDGDGGTDLNRSSITKKLPAGDYHVVVYTGGLGPNYMPTVTVTYSGTTKTYKNSVPSGASGTFSTDRYYSWLQLVEEFHLDNATNVKLTINPGNTNPMISNGLAAIY